MNNGHDDGMRNEHKLSRDLCSHASDFVFAEINRRHTISDLEMLERALTRSVQHLSRLLTDVQRLIKARRARNRTDALLDPASASILEDRKLRREWNAPVTADHGDP